MDGLSHFLQTANFKGMENVNVSTLEQSSSQNRCPGRARESNAQDAVRNRRFVAKNAT